MFSGLNSQQDSDDNTKKAGKKIKKVPVSFCFAILILFWTVLIAVSLRFNLIIAYEHAENGAHIQALTVLEKDLAYLRWSLNSAGVYSPINRLPSLASPNQYISASGQELASTFGFKLTKSEPMCMSCLAWEMENQRNGLRRHTLYNDLFNPFSIRDEWELVGIKQFELGLDRELSGLQEIAGASDVRLIRPRQCEHCASVHLWYPQGGLKNIAPMASILASAPVSADGVVPALIISHMLLWVFGIVVFGFFHRSLRRKDVEQSKTEGYLQKLTQELKLRDLARTKNLHKRQQEVQAFVDNTTALVYLKDMEGRYLVASKHYATLLGGKLDTIIGFSDAELMPKAFNNRIYVYESEVLATQRAVEPEDVFSFELNAYMGSFFPVLNENGAIEGVGVMLIDITQRLHIEEGLKLAKTAAENASIAKTDFLANISHEIRTPLGGVIGMSDLLLRTKLNSDQNSMAMTIKNAGNSLLSLLNDVLDISKIEAGKVSLDITTFSLREVVYAAAQSLAPLAYQKQLEFVVNIMPQVPDCLKSDCGNIRQILINLLSNALKFTQRGEVVLTVSVLAQDAKKVHLRFSVSDSGIGIEEGKQKRIFSAFEQAEVSTTREYGGTGLGLAISSRLAELLGAKLKLESHPGKGSKFWFDLELPYFPNNKTPVELAYSKGLLKGIKVLVLDDSQLNRSIFIEQLESWGMIAEPAVSVDEAMQMLKGSKRVGQPFRLVLTDLKMPAKGGLEFVRELKEDLELCGLPVILLSSDDLSETIALKSEFSFILNKPAHPAEIMRAIISVLGICENAFFDLLQGKPAKSIKSVSNVQLKILLVEDMEMNQLVSSRMLLDLGHSVQIASNGKQALEILQQENFDIVFMDIQMPVMDGVEATQKIRKMEAANPRLPYQIIVAMTAHALKGDKEKYLANGVDDYLSKPVLLDDLVEIIDRLKKRFNLKSNPNIVGESKLARVKSNIISKDTGSDRENHESLLDSRVMENSFAGNLGLTVESMQIYLQDAVKLLSEIEEEIEQEDNSELTVKSHALKGITGYYTKGAAYKACLNLEIMGRAGKLPLEKKQVAEQMTLVRELILSLTSDMDTFIKKNNSRA